MQVNLNASYTAFNSGSVYTRGGKNDQNTFLSICSCIWWPSTVKKLLYDVVFDINTGSQW